LWGSIVDVSPILRSSCLALFHHLTSCYLQHSEAVRKLYKALVERRESYQPSPIPEPEQLDSPFASVPGATPAST